MELMQASRQWSTRPADERYTSLLDMHAHFELQRVQSRSAVVSSKAITIEPANDGSYKGLVVTGPQGGAFNPTHWSFGQLSALVGAPAGYLRTIPSPLAADCLNFGLQVTRDAQDVGVLVQKNGSATLRAVTGPKYGRIHNHAITEALIERVGDGITGAWRVPGEFGKAVQVDKDNTTLYAGDRDMFVFLADEERRIEVPGRRDGKAGSMARGFFVWNSEVGSKTFGIATFLFDYVCCNRIVWGATQYKQIRIRHTASAPDRFFEEIKPALISYSQASTAGITDAIANAKAHRLEDKVDAFLATRFGARTVESLKALHMLEEQRPIETRWDVITAVTAKARAIKWQDERVELETEAGKLLEAA